MAFDKCTLLSSQGSDAPPTQPHDQARRATSQSYPPRSACQIDAPEIRRPGSQPMTALHEVEAPILALRSADSQVERGSGVVLRLRGDQAFRPVRFPVGRTSNNLRGFRGSDKSGRARGRVAHVSAVPEHPPLRSPPRPPGVRRCCSRRKLLRAADLSGPYLRRAQQLPQSATRRPCARTPARRAHDRQRMLRCRGTQKGPCPEAEALLSPARGV